MRSLDECKISQKDLNIIDQWAVHWQAKFNPDKCEHIRLLIAKILFSLLSYTPKFKQLPNVTYLRVTID